MNGNVTVRDVMSREFVGVSESDGALETAELMMEEDADSVVVLRGNDPIGVMTPRDVLGLLVDGTDPAEATVADAMTEGVFTVEPARPLPEAADVMSAESARRLLVVDGDEPVGLLSEHDVLTASVLDPAIENGTAGIETDAEDHAETGIGATAEVATGIEPDADAGEAGPESMTAEDAYSDQGICEMCGSLTRELAPSNGQLLCPDCRDI